MGSKGSLRIVENRGIGALVRTAQRFPTTLPLTGTPHCGVMEELFRYRLSIRAQKETRLDSITVAHGHAVSGY